jgi:hypothetical protein
MTVTDFAKKMGMSRITARKKLDGVTEFTAREIKMACDVLGIPIADVSYYFFST